MEDGVPLLKGSGDEGTRWCRRWRAVAKELNRVIFIALPMIVVMVSQYLLRVSPLLMLGHLGELSLSSASIATSLCNVTGYSLLFGMSSALETLCGQAYGGEQFRRVGTFTYGAILCMFLACIPVSIMWIYTENLLVFFGHDPLISAQAGKFAMLLIPTLFPYAILQSLARYLQTQSLILPMFWGSLASLCFQLPLCWAFIFKLNLGNAGGALSIGISYWFYVILLVLYAKFSPKCAKTRPTFSKDVFATLGEFFRFAIPSAVMVCLEWWSFEIVVLLSGMLPNPQLEASVLSICLTIGTLHYLVTYSFGAAVSTLVSNDLGAGKPEAARVTVCAVLILLGMEFLIASLTIYICRGILGYAFSGETQVISYVNDMAPYLCLIFFMDSTQSVFSGVARGSGWQHVAAYVNLGSYYLVGIPAALILGFVFHFKAKGLWTGLVAGATVQSLSLSIITYLTDWERLAMQVRERIFGEEIIT